MSETVHTGTQEAFLGAEIGVDSVNYLNDLVAQPPTADAATKEHPHTASDNIVQLRRPEEVKAYAEEVSDRITQMRERALNRAA